MAKDITKIRRDTIRLVRATKFLTMSLETAKYRNAATGTANNKIIHLSETGFSHPLERASVIKNDHMLAAPVAMCLRILLP
jgi:hypothetical protein